MAERSQCFAECTKIRGSTKVESEEVSRSTVFAKESQCLQYFGSAFWKYPVHTFVGFIIKGIAIMF